MATSIACVIGCDSSEGTASAEPPPITDPKPAGEVELDQAIAEHGVFAFCRGWGTSSTVLIFLPGRRVELKEYGCFHFRQSAGTYSIDEAGTLTVRLDPADAFPPMFFLRDTTSLLLLPQEQGKAPSKEVEKYRAFRPLPPEEQANFRATLTSNLASSPATPPHPAP
jgi:hypothetical protein